MNKKIISSIQINLDDLPSVKQNRTIKVTGETGAKFLINVIRINGNSKESYFNFFNKTFTTSFNSQNNLNGELNSSFFSTTISFPKDLTGDVYKILVMPGSNTELANGESVFSKNINQAGQTIVYIELDEGTEVNSALANYYTSNPPAPAFQSRGSTTNTNPTKVAANFTVTNANHDTYGFGLKLPNLASTFSIPDSYFYTAVVKTVNGAINASTTVVLDDVSNLVVGMVAAYFNSGSLSGSPAITAINGNTLTLSVAQTISDGVGIQFRAYGPTLIKSGFGYSPKFLNFVAKGTPITTTVRANVVLPSSNSEVSILVNGTRGISIGTRFTGFNVNTAGNNNLVGQVGASETQGTLTISAFAGAATDVVAKTVTAGTELNIIGSHRVVDITGTVLITKYPDADLKLMLDLNKFITVGAGAS
jgi:hypothetical protein